MAEAGGGGTVEVFADRRVGDGDEGTGTLGEALAAEGGDAVFGHDVLHEMAGANDPALAAELASILGYSGREGAQC